MLGYWCTVRGCLSPHACRSAAPIVAQYYQFLRLGRSGYTKLMRNMKSISNYLAARIGQMGARPRPACAMLAHELWTCPLLPAGVRLQRASRQGTNNRQEDSETLLSVPAPRSSHPTPSSAVLSHVRSRVRSVRCRRPLPHRQRGGGPAAGSVLAHQDGQRRRPRLHRVRTRAMSRAGD